MVNDIFIAADETTASGDTICWFTSRFSLYSITVGTSASETNNVRIRVHRPSSSCFRSRSSQSILIRPECVSVCLRVISEQLNQENGKSYGTGFFGKVQI